MLSTGGGTAIPVGLVTLLSTSKSSFVSPLLLLLSLSTRAFTVLARFSRRKFPERTETIRETSKAVREREVRFIEMPPPMSPPMPPPEEWAAEVEELEE